MATQHKSARGIPIDMDRLRLANETTIAVGNMKVNARGDQLGEGGRIIKTRAQVLAEKNKLHNGPIADDNTFKSSLKTDDILQVPDLVQPTPAPGSPVAIDMPLTRKSTEKQSPNYVKPRGSFAESVARETEVIQELLEPMESPNSNEDNSSDYVKPTGKVADAVANETEIKQELLKPVSTRKSGIQRI